MNDLSEAPPKRKLLSLKKEKDTLNFRGEPRHFVRSENSIFMVYSPDGYMPKRVYRPDEQSIALSHAKSLAAEHGGRFYVMRAWRAFEPAE